LLWQNTFYGSIVALLALMDERGDVDTVALHKMAPIYTGMGLPLLPLDEKYLQMISLCLNEPG